MQKNSNEELTQREQQQVRYCYAFCPEEVTHIIQVADDVCSHRFLFDLRWDMERTWEPVQFGDKPDWELIPAGDPEFVWQFNRHRFFICLGQAYLLTNDEKYADKFVYLLSDWIGRMRSEGIHRGLSWRSLEAGLRGGYWTKAMQYFRNSPAITDEIMAMFTRSLIEHAEYLLECHDDYKYISNWGVLENHGLFAIGAALRGYGRSEYYISRALTNLTAAARRQVMRDGTQWEQSPMYHNEVMFCFMDVIMLADRTGISIPEELRETVHRMAYADLKWQKPDGHQFMTGDSDDTDIRDMLTLAAWLFRDPVLKSGGYERFDFETVWLCGVEAAAEYAAMAREKPEFISAALEDSGNYYLRASWEEKANLLHFGNGPQGGGHGHADDLHVDLVFGGRDVLVDAGRYTYAVERGRLDFKNPDAHNTIIVDDQFFTICEGAWGYTRLSQPVNRYFHTSERYDYVEGGHLGYIDKGIIVRRRIIYIRPDIYIIADEISASGHHCSRRYFHFSEKGQVTLQGHRAVYEDAAGAVQLQFLGDGIMVELTEGEIARHYNRKEENGCIIVTQEQQGFQAGMTVISETDFTARLIPVGLPRKPGRCRLDEAEAVEIVTADGRTYIVMISHTQVNAPGGLMEAGGCRGAGNVIIFDKQTDLSGGYVLKW